MKEKVTMKGTGISPLSLEQSFPLSGELARVTKNILSCPHAEMFYSRRFTHIF